MDSGHVKIDVYSMFMTLMKLSRFLDINIMGYFDYMTDLIL